MPHEIRFEAEVEIDDCEQAPDGIDGLRIWFGSPITGVETFWVPHYEGDPYFEGPVEIVVRPVKEDRPPEPMEGQTTMFEEEQT